MNTKKCKICGIEKPLDDFYKHKDIDDGNLNICKECKKQYSNTYRENNLEKVREYDRNRPNALERIKKQKEALKNDIIKYKKNQEAKNNWNRNNKLKRNAHNKVKRAIEKGILVKPLYCELCGSTIKIEAHHYDYNKPLDVIFVCSKCHHQLHKDTREIQRKAS
jgi:ribosome-binding protein aMBF1 (putative translation factor)